jgi:hypothetical protein
MVLDHPRGFRAIVRVVVRAEELEIPKRRDSPKSRDLPESRDLPKSRYLPKSKGLHIRSSSIEGDLTAGTVNCAQSMSLGQQNKCLKPYVSLTPGSPL